MYTSKNITGAIPLSELLRMPKGANVIYELCEGREYQQAQNFIQSYANRAGAKIKQKKLLLVDPVTAITVIASKVTVLKTAVKKNDH